MKFDNPANPNWPIKTSSVIKQSGETPNSKLASGPSAVQYSKTAGLDLKELLCYAYMFRNKNLQKHWLKNFEQKSYN